MKPVEVSDAELAAVLGCEVGDLQRCARGLILTLRVLKAEGVPKADVIERITREHPERFARCVLLMVLDHVWAEP